MEYHSHSVRDGTHRFNISHASNFETRLDVQQCDQFVLCPPSRIELASWDVMPRKLAAVVKSEIAKDVTKLPSLEPRDLLQRVAAPPN
jgi:hypothetical protein